MSQCPHCGTASFHFLRKWSIGPVKTVRCRACGKKVGVSKIAWLAVGCGAIGVLGGLAVESFYLPLVGVGLSALIYYAFVSLVPKE